MRLSRLMLATLLPLAACEALLTGPAGDPDAPSNLTYQLIPSGDPSAPLGVLLMWEIPRSGRANAFNVYGRTSAGAAWQLRATTTSPSFHDEGTPEAQYYVATRDENGNEIANSGTITIDLQAHLPAPQGLASVSLNRAVQLSWSSNAVNAGLGTFDHYRVYSTTYDGSRGVCTANWELEGTTVSDGFVAGNLANGVSRCFAVSAVTHDGHESVWSDARLDTPRYDARNVLVYATLARTDSSAFLFFDDSTHVLGVVAPMTRRDVDFTIVRHPDNSLWITPARSAVTVAAVGAGPVADLTSVDRAPSTGFAPTALQAIPGRAYAFRIEKSDGVHFAAIRIGFATADYAVFDWAYQSASGNPELNRSIPAPST
ncbi:MAG TPA: hypothetical protein VHB25_18945 [Gemmatimonadaceae bacterium]|nr:hypothetical protein [Gemmatimonadaceae bacterium]